MKNTMKTNMIDQLNGPESAPNSGEELDLKRSLEIAGEYIASASELEKWVKSKRMTHEEARAEFLTYVEQPIAKIYDTVAKMRPTLSLSELNEFLLEQMPDASENATLLRTVVVHTYETRQFMHYLDDNQVAYRQPNDDEHVDSGIDLIVEDHPFGIRYRNSLKLLSSSATDGLPTHPRVLMTNAVSAAPHKNIGDMFLRVIRANKARALRKIQPQKPAQKQVNGKKKHKNVQPSTHKKTTPPVSRPNRKSPRDNGIIPYIAPVMASKGMRFTLEMPNNSQETTTHLVEDIVRDALRDTEHNPLITAEAFGSRINASINPNENDATTTAVKQYAAAMCGAGGVKELDASNPLKLSHTLIDSAEGTLTATGLTDVLTRVGRIASVEVKVIDSYLNAITGARVEKSAAKLLAAMGYNIMLADEDQDTRGADLFIDDVPIDVKSSRMMANRAALRELSITHENRIPAIRFVPPFTYKTFHNHLIVPDEEIAKLAADPQLRAQIDAAIANYREIFGRRITYQGERVAPQPARRLAQVALGAPLAHS